MLIPLHDKLRFERKKSRLTAEDVEYLLNISNSSNFGKYERGIYQFKIEMVVTYSLLFSLPLDEILQEVIERNKDELPNRIQEILLKLNTEKLTPRQKHRKGFLERVLLNLASKEI